MDLNVVFDVPSKVAQGLQNGSLERVGGIVRDASSKRVVMWLQEGGSSLSKPLGQPPLAGIDFLAGGSHPLLAGANLGVSMVGFAMVLHHLNRISDQIRSLELKVDRLNRKLDDQAFAQLKAGINACQNAVDLDEPGLRVHMAGQAITTLHAARQFFNQQAIQSAGLAEAVSADYIGLAFAALAAEVQTYLQLDEGEKASRTLRQGLTELRPGLIKLMTIVLECSCHYLRPEFSGKIDLEMVLWLHNSFRRMKRTPGEEFEQISASQLFDELRPKISKIFASEKGWHGMIPQVIVDTSSIPERRVGPLNQGVSSSARWRCVNDGLVQGLNKIVALAEAHDRLFAQVLQLEEMQSLGLKPSALKERLRLPEGQAAAVVLDPIWLGETACA